MSAYVKRTNPETDRVGWTGPIRNDKQAEREATAWRDAGWAAEVHPSTPEIRAQVRAWEKAKAQR